MGNLRVYHWLGAVVLIAVLLPFAGCQGPEPNLKPKLKREYVLPPTADARFSSPATYPKETLDVGQFTKDLERGKPSDPSKDSGPGLGMMSKGAGGY
jgi:hypothetical protein